MRTSYWLLALSMIATTAVVTSFVRGYAIRRLLDVPNERSSHAIPTPRGGGVAIVATMFPAIALKNTFGDLPLALTLSLLAGGAFIAGIGWVDDHRSVPALVRLIIHFLAVALCAWSLGSLPPIHFGVATLDLGIAGTVCAVVFLVWFLNLYNFMDGIDGIAGVEAISVAGGAAWLLAIRAGDPSMIWLLVALASAVGGFLVWNWPPARIFMGDAGSGFIGFALGAIAWATVVAGQLSIWVWMILAGAFVVDATVTLLRRWKRGERLQEAHRSHAYQRLSRRFGSHAIVTLGFLGINLFWLAPLAWAAVAWPAWGSVLTLAAWTPLVVIAWRCGAGLPDD